VHACDVILVHHIFYSRPKFLAAPIFQTAISHQDLLKQFICTSEVGKPRLARLGITISDYMLLVCISGRRC